MGVVTHTTDKYQMCIDACNRCAQTCHECIGMCLLTDMPYYFIPERMEVIA